MVCDESTRQDYSVLGSLKNCIYDSLAIALPQIEPGSSLEIVYSACYNQVVRKPVPNPYSNVHIAEDGCFDLDLDPYFRTAKTMFNQISEEKEFLIRDDLPKDDYYDQESDEPEENIVDQLGSDLLDQPKETEDPKKEETPEPEKEEGEEEDLLDDLLGE